MYLKTLILVDGSTYNTMGSTIHVHSFPFFFSFLKFPIAIEKFMDALRLNRNCWKVKISLNRLTEDVAKEFT